MIVFKLEALKSNLQFIKCIYENTFYCPVWNIFWWANGTLQLSKIYPKKKKQFGRLSSNLLKSRYSSAITIGADVICLLFSFLLWLQRFLIFYWPLNALKYRIQLSVRWVFSFFFLFEPTWQIVTHGAMSCNAHCHT